jgi:hypothetical protein
MAKLAMYDKHDGVGDRHTNEYFRHDFISKNNLATRLCVGMGAMVWVGLDVLKTILVDETDFFELDFRLMITNAILFTVTIMMVYSVVGTVQGVRRYLAAQQRLRKYSLFTYQLERINERIRLRTEANQAALTEEREPEGPSPGDRAADLYYGTNPGHQRNPH